MQRSEQVAAPVDMPALDWQSDEIVRRYCEDHQRTLTEGQACFDAFKQFMVVCAEAQAPRAPSVEIDEMWHTALMFTRSYREFCESYLNVFLHHEPVEEKANAALYATTKADAARRFARLDERFWSSVENVARCGGCGSIYRP